MEANKIIKENNILTYKVTGAIEECTEETAEFFSLGYMKGYRYGLSGSFAAGKENTLAVCNEEDLVRLIKEREPGATFVTPLVRFKIEEPDTV